jgi:8-oxo-dGTP diphosphatase
MKNSQNRPLIGVATFVFNQENKVLFGLRQGSHGADTWSLPGGHLEFNESWEKCAIREVKEETGIQVVDLNLLTVTNDIFTKENKHYNTVFLTAKHFSGKPKRLEKNKCKKWKWFHLDDLPEPLFLPIQNLQKQMPEFFQ